MQVKADGRREGFFIDGSYDGDELEEPETPELEPSPPPVGLIFGRRHVAPANVRHLAPANVNDGTMERASHLEQLVLDLKEENARLKAEIRRLTAEPDAADDPLRRVTPEVTRRTITKEAPAKEARPGCGVG